MIELGSRQELELKVELEVELENSGPSLDLKK